MKGQSRFARLSGASVPIFIAFAFIVSSAPSGQAASYTPPVPRVKVQFYTQSTGFNCATGTILTKPFFKKSTDSGGFADKIVASNCTANNVHKFALRQHDITVYFPLNISTSRNYMVNVSWQSLAVLSGHVAGGSCTLHRVNGFCMERIGSWVDGEATLLDLTNQSKFSPNGSWSYVLSTDNESNCTRSGCTLYSFNPSGFNQTVWLNHTFGWNSLALNATHSYEIEIEVNGGAEFDLFGRHTSISPSSGFAFLSAAPPLGYERLSSIQIS